MVDGYVFESEVEPVNGFDLEILNTWLRAQRSGLGASGHPAQAPDTGLRAVRALGASFRFWIQWKKPAVSGLFLFHPISSEYQVGD